MSIFTEGCTGWVLILLHAQSLEKFKHHEF